MKYKFGQTILMEQMLDNILLVMGSSTKKEAKAIKTIIAKGCTDIAVEAVEDYMDSAPWNIHDAVAQFEKGE